MDSVASRHVPICVSGISDVVMYQRHYPGKIEVWVKFKDEASAIKFNYPRRFVFETYSVEEFNLPQVKHELLRTFSKAGETDDDSQSVESSLKESLNQLKTNRSSKKSQSNFDRSKLSRRKSASKQSSKSSESSDLTTDVYTGIIIDYGIEDRELEGREFNQYQIRFKDDSRDGNITQVWGEDIKRAIKDADVCRGNRIRIEEIRVKGERKKSFNIDKL